MGDRTGAANWAPNTVASSVEVLVYASMKDAQFAAPVRSPILPYNIPNVA